MDAWSELIHVVHLSSRLLLAVLLGGIVGWERGRRGRAAGIRTHMMVALGAAVYTVVAVDVAPSAAQASQLAEVVKGIATGIGFLGAGAILKRSNDGQISGLTTASSIWLTAGLGFAVGAGRVWLAVAAASFSVAILLILGAWLDNHKRARADLQRLQRTSEWTPASRTRHRRRRRRLRRSVATGTIGHSANGQSENGHSPSSGKSAMSGTKSASDA